VRTVQAVKLRLSVFTQRRGRSGTSRSGTFARCAMHDLPELRVSQTALREPENA